MVYKDKLKESRTRREYERRPNVKEYKHSLRFKNRIKQFYNMSVQDFEDMLVRQNYECKAAEYLNAS